MCWFDHGPELFWQLARVGALWEQWPSSSRRDGTHLQGVDPVSAGIPTRHQPLKDDVEISATQSRFDGSPSPQTDFKEDPPIVPTKYWLREGWVGALKCQSEGGPWKWSSGAR